MNKLSHLTTWDLMRMRHGVTLRLLEQIPADQLASHPIAGMRTPVELVVHMYAGTRQYAESVRTGVLADFDEAAAVAAIKTPKQLLAFVTDAWAAADREARKLTDAQLGATVKTSWGAFPGSKMYEYLHDEYLHHRGQLYAFIRRFGTEPVSLWDFDHNAQEFRPGETAKA